MSIEEQLENCLQYVYESDRPIATNIWLHESLKTDLVEFKGIPISYTGSFRRNLAGPEYQPTEFGTDACWIFTKESEYETVGLLMWRLKPIHESTLP